VIRRRRSKPTDTLSQLLSDTQEMVSKVLRENRSLRARNVRLERELERLSDGWDQIKKLAQAAPRRARRGR
jgi:cell division protein FtsB